MEKETLEPIEATVACLSELSRPHYSADLPVHNWDYACEVLGDAQRIVGLCQENNSSINERVVVAAAINCAVNFHQPLPEGFTSKEQYSAHVSGLLLPKAGYDSEEIQQVQEAIMSSSPNVPCLSDEARTLRQARLANLTWIYPQFKARTLRLWEEDQVLGNTGSFTDWITTKVTEYDTYLAQDITLGMKQTYGRLWDRIPDPHQSRFKFQAYPHVRQLEKDIPAIVAEIELAASQSQG